MTQSDFSVHLMEWYRLHGRELPWRGIEDPYRIWVSEVILQQTRVQQGWDYYLRFVSAFPTVQTLAEAPLNHVMKLWQGLGYYTRARNLHRAARLVVDEYGGQIPSTYQELLRLPGLGPYAAAAVASFAFGEPVPAIDGNVYRILSRVFGVFESPGRAIGRRIFRDLALEVMDQLHPARFNQAMIDFGALQCRPGLPDCAVCPFMRRCYAHANGIQTALPARERATRIRTRHLHFLVLRYASSTFIELRQGDDIWHSLYQFPLVETPGPLPPPELLARPEVEAIAGTGFHLRHVSEVQRQLLSHQELFVRFYILALDTLPYGLLERFEMVPIGRLGDFQVPVVVGNYLAAEENAEYFT